MQVKCWRVEDLGGTLGLSHGDVENPSDHCGSPLVVELLGLTKWLHVAAGSLTSAPVSGITGHICLCSAKVYQHPSTLTLLMLFHIHHSVQFIRSAWISHEVYVWCMLKSRSLSDFVIGCQGVALTQLRRKGCPRDLAVPLFCSSGLTLCAMSISWL